MTLVAGIDGGGTHIRAVIADGQGRELGRGESPGAVVGVDEAATVVERVEDAVRTATKEAGASLPLRGMWAGLAGAGREAARLQVAGGLGGGRLAEEVIVGTDVEAAFHDAFGADPGILLIAGTGSIAWARSEGGDVVRVGGWGEKLGDEGSGYAIGLGALRAVARAEDGRGPATAVTGILLERLSLDRTEDLIAWTAAATKAEVAGIVRMVAEACAEGDQVANDIFGQAADELSAHLSAVLARGNPWKEQPELVLWGGLLREGGALREVMEAAAAQHPVRLSARPVDPAMGAARLALGAASRAP